MLFDEILENINGFGRFQWYVIFLSSIGWFPVSINHMCSIFIAAVPSHICTATVYQVIDTNFSDFSANKQCSLNITDRSESDNDTNKCVKWTYDVKQTGKTIVSEWDLVCDRRWLISISTSVYMAGLLAGLMPIGILADKKGRRKAMLISVTGMTIFMYAVALSPNIYLFMVFRFLSAFFSQALGGVSYGYALEFVTMKYRILAAYLNASPPWSSGFLVLIGLYYLIRDWRTVMLIAAGISTAVTVVLFILLPESPRWLYAAGNTKQGDLIVQKIAQMNRTDHQLKKGLHITVEGSHKADTIDLIRTPEMRKRTVIACYLWFAVSLAYFGLFFNASSMSVNIYLNITIGAFLEILGSIIHLIIITKLGRRIPGIVLYIFGGLSLLLILAFRKGDLVISVLSIIGRMIMGIAFAVAYIYSAELSPTLLRSNSLSAGSVSARAGAVIAPFVITLDEFHPVISSTIFGAASVLAGLLIFLLPETKGMRLPDTIDEVEMKDGKELERKGIQEIYSVS